MRMIEISALPNGSHRNQTFNGTLPDGWAVLPDELETTNFPFGEVTAEEVVHYREETVEQDGELVTVKKPYGVMTVIKWVAGEIPNPDNGEDENVGYIPTPTLRYRVTALEESMASLEDALCEMDAANAEAIASIEDALCELDI